MSRDIVAAGNIRMTDQFTACRNKEITNMQYMTQYEETETFQKLRKRCNRENVNTWKKVKKPWRQEQREKHKRKYDNSLDVA